MVMCANQLMLETALKIVLPLTPIHPQIRVKLIKANRELNRNLDKAQGEL
jgi:hypothetical protein